MRLAVLILVAASIWAQEFLQKPYLQLGNNPENDNPESLSLLWHSLDNDQPWSVQWKSEGSSEWRAAQVRMLRRIAVRGIRPHRVWEAALAGLPSGREFTYRVLLDGRELFSAAARAPRKEGEPHSFVVVGDTAQGSSGQRDIAYEIFKAKPEYMVIVGDIVYSRGLISQYYERYFPVYNCDTPTPGRCAPVLRGTPTVAVLGNHDVNDSTTVNLGSYPGALAFFYYWSQPLNGPITDRNSPHLPRLTGSPSIRETFYETAKDFPQMAMFSFDYGDVHWTMLDSNEYVDWKDPKLRQWVRDDLRKAKGAKWKFVAQHHPGFSSAGKHFGDQWMRQLGEIFQEGGVDLVFAGHVHNYQRSYPIQFSREDWTPDKSFDGASKTKPDGAIWLVTGAGGASLKGKGLDKRPERWQPYTAKYFSAKHSFTLVEVSPEGVLVRQIARDGEEIDRFRISR